MSSCSNICGTKQAQAAPEGGHQRYGVRSYLHQFYEDCTTSIWEYEDDFQIQRSPNRWSSVFWKVNEWSLKIRKEMRVVDRQIRDIQREEEKVKRSVKDAAKKGQKDVCVVLAKEMIRSRKAVSKLYASKAHMNSVLMGMKNQLAVLRVAGSLQKSTEVMKAMQSLVKIPEIQATMRELSKEMMKAGIIEEMLEDTFESMDDQEEMEEAAEMEIDKILFEITAGALGKAPSKVTDALPEPEPSGAMAASEDEEEEEALEAMQSRLATLRS